MSVPWIKIEHTTPDKPEILEMAEILGLDPDAVTGKLIRAWIWADQQTIIGDAPRVTKALLNRYTFCDGFSEALEKVGWLVTNQDGITFPHFDRHNGKSAKRRGLTQQRMETYRASGLASRDAVRVTKASPEIEVEEARAGRDSNNVQGRGALKKRIETASAKDPDDSTKLHKSHESHNPPHRSHAKKNDPPTESQWQSYANEFVKKTIDRGDVPVEDIESIFDYYVSNGWKQNNGNRIIDWKAACRSGISRYRKDVSKTNGITRKTKAEEEQCKAQKERTARVAKMVQKQKDDRLASLQNSSPEPTLPKLPF